MAGLIRDGRLPGFWECKLWVSMELQANHNEGFGGLGMQGSGVQFVGMNGTTGRSQQRFGGIGVQAVGVNGTAWVSDCFNIY